VASTAYPPGRPFASAHSAVPLAGQASLHVLEDANSDGHLPLGPFWVVVALTVVYFLCMAFKTLTISEEAHERLRKHKMPGESFTQVILRELPEPLETAGEVLDFLKSQAPPRLDRIALESLRKGRGRRSNRR